MITLHLGDHIGLAMRDLAGHLLELDHLALAAATIVAGLWACRLGRRAVAARVRVNTERRP